MLFSISKLIPSISVDEESFNPSIIFAIPADNSFRHMKTIVIMTDR